jgi:DNA-directed RNA polymerase specialized sigma24 family protein
MAEAAEVADISVDTVKNIDAFLGLSERYDERLRDLAVAAVREGMSVSQLAKISGMSRSRSHRYMVAARGVLAELGEVSL